MPSCRHVSMVGTYTMHGRLDSDRYGYTRGYGSGWVVILSTGRVRVRETIMCYGYGSGSKDAVPADLYCTLISTGRRNLVYPLFLWKLNSTLFTIVYSVHCTCMYTLCQVHIINEH